MGNTWIICPKSQHNIAVRVQHDSVPPHGDGRKAGSCDIRVLEGPGLFFGAPNRLEIMAVKMEWMFPGIQVIHNNLYNLTALEDKGVCVFAVNRGVGCQIPGTQRRVQCGNLGSGIRDVVEEGT